MIKKITCQLSLILLIILVLPSCSKKDDATPDTSLIVNVVTPADLLQTDIAKGYIILSDNDGKTLAFSEIVNGQTTTIKPATPYTGETFTLTEFYVYEENGVKTIAGTSITSLPVKTWNWKPESAEGEDETETTASFTFTNPTEGVNYNVSTNDTYNDIYTFNAQSFRVNGASKLFISSYSSDDVKKYHIYDNNGTGFSAVSTPYTIDLSMITSTFVEKSIDIPSGVADVYFGVSGKIKSGSLAGEYHIGNAYNQNSKMNYPTTSEGFDDYFFGIEFQKDGIPCYNEALTTPDLTSLNVSPSIGGSKNAPTLTTTGSFDYALLIFEIPTTDDSWKIICPQSTTTQLIAIPEIPNEINSSSVKTSDFEYTGVNFSDYKDYSGYTEFMNALDVIDSNTTLENKTIFFDNGSSNARKATRVNRKRSIFK